MDRVLSTRVDEAIVERISGLARQLHVSKKNVIEQAVALLADKVETEEQKDIFDHTFGAWRRKESVGQTVHRARAEFRQSMERHRA
jgi:predicted transcriptional regulator